MLIFYFQHINLCGNSKNGYGIDLNITILKRFRCLSKYLQMDTHQNYNTISERRCFCLLSGFLGERGLLMDYVSFHLIFP